IRSNSAGEYGTETIGTGIPARGITCSTRGKREPAMVKWDCMLKSFLFRPLGWGILGLWLCQCSLSLEDPEDEARAKLAKTVPVSFAALEGRWAADSTYTAEAVSAHVFPGNDIRLEIYADTSLHAVDASRLVFARGLAGRYRLRGDTLFHQS